MFLNKYMNEIYYNQIIKKYDKEYLNLIDEELFLRNYEIFQKYNFYYIDEIILYYLELFELDNEELDIKLQYLIKKLGYDYLEIISKNIFILDNILDSED